MGKKVIGFRVESSFGIEATCILERKSTVVEEFKTPYKDFEVQIDVDFETETMIYGVSVIGADKLFNVIDKNDCLPDVGFLDYENKELDIKLKNVTLRELYKEILSIVL